MPKITTMETKNSGNSGCPFGGSGQPSVYSADDLTYQTYLKIPELLSLQVPESKPPHHDEMLFIIIHQAYELWFKLIIHELETAMDYMQERNVLRAQHFIKRVVEIQKLLVKQIHLLETMTPIEFLGFRDRLNPASGFQSLQFREVEFLAGVKDKGYFTYFKNRPEMVAQLKARYEGRDLRGVYYQMLAKLGFDMPKDAATRENEGDAPAKDKIIQALRKIYQSPEDNLPLYLLSESLLEFDEYIGLWRDHHVRVVERVIGFKRGTGGSAGVEYLQSTTSKKCFPLLWEVRTYLERP